ncbi:MIP/aquaporin family protein [Lacticaseibacillus saniviri]|uniref:Glycerol uptake facilitator related permease (Major Intrinsic Protein Family) n=1 Tax=Lacticaseibacillus saniviri JCM 17471 = DSM 24301 TaxID=1293598 RepID=A0A0R2MWS0_9LACO|nr:MIP/aquaporin family protein [Lacticaseibacillus saniviri]KRO17953.1 Glycerol uptake facilitator related permease (Major Intrinsic Protein Family) [Lacticaseibacillus saniviri JCM 17471 = DSM 24301]MCG4281736.1 aquaporin family protein [Lacticaseibacillus saniviri]
MTYALGTRLIAEFIGTAIMVILGNGSVANVDLKGTKGNGSDWLVIAVGYGSGVMIPAMMFGGISGNHINPAFTLGLAFSGLFPWAEVLPYILVQFAGAMVGQLLVVAAYKPHYDLTTNTQHVLGTFSTINATKSKLNGFINEFLGSFILFIGALGITKAPFFKDNLGTAHMALGFLVMTLVASLGGPTGPALNPARDLGPRILHAILPLRHKGDSDWGYAWVPVVAPILASICAVAVYKLFFL